MASVPYNLPPTLAERSRARHWPSAFPQRTLLRLLLCCPYLALALWANHRGFYSTVNTKLVQHASDVTLFSTRLGFLARSYPPIPTFLAAIVPGGAAGLALLGALAAGGLLHVCWERLIHAQAPGWLIAALLVTLGGTPAFAFDATQDLVGFTALACFAVALAGTLDFLFSARTISGFVAGLGLGAAVFCDPATFVYAAVMAIGVPFLAWERYRRDPPAIVARMVVLAYPTLMFLGAWAFFEWRFTGAVWHQLSLAPHVLQFPAGIADGLKMSLGHVGVQILCAPVFLVSAALTLRRRPIAFIAFLPVPLALALSAWIGFPTPADEGIVLLDIVGVLSVPSRLRRSVGVLYLVAAIAGVIVSCLLADGSTVGPFLRGIGV